MKQLKYALLTLIALTFSSYGFCSKAVLKDVRGETISFDSLKGKWVLINYWASWCQSCLDEISELNRFYKKNKTKVALFAVNFDLLPLPSQIALIKKYRIAYPSLQYDPGRSLNIGEIRGVPATFVFNPEGKLSSALYGGQTEESLNQAVLG
jgi:thiol-disulfide isomerase/thioredoxin